MYMPLFNWKKKKETSDSECFCKCKTLNTIENKTTDSHSYKTQSRVFSIKVLGTGCASCHQMFKSTKETVGTVGLSIEVEYITDLEKIMSYGAISMPVLVINEKIVSMGKVLKTDEIKKILEKYDLP